jgi:hypothetical protein
VLVTLRLHLRDGRERLLAQELAPGDDSSPCELLERIAKDGRVPLGDRESYPLEEIERVELVPPPAPEQAPSWTEDGRPAGVELRDEDVAAALRERYDR